MPAPITRAEGYRLSAGKEAAALALAQRFLLDACGIATAPIRSRDANYLHGDLTCPSGATIEVKGQPIDPDRYTQNFVEVFEDVSAGTMVKHADGFARIADILSIPEADLEAVTVWRRGQRGRLGRPSHVSVSIASIAGSALTIYVNRDTAVLYAYPSPVLLRLIRRAVLERGLHRGAGRCNEDGFAVYVPIPGRRWRLQGNEWQFIGPEPMRDSAVSAIQAILAERS